MLTSLLLLAFGPKLNGQSAGEAWKKLEDAMKYELEAPKNEEGKSDRYDVRDRQRTALMQLRSVMDQSDSAQSDMSLSQLASVFHSEEVVRAMENLRALLAKEREAKDAALLTRMNEAIKHAADAIRNAKEPRDLDGALNELAQFGRGREDRMSETTRAASYKIQPARQFILRWQDYLSAVKAGDAKRAVELLRNMASSYGENVDFMPRSEILALIEQNTRANSSLPPRNLDDVLAKAKSLADVAGVIKELHGLDSQRQQMSSSGSSSDELRQAIYALQPIEKTYREFLAGLPTTLEPSLNQSDQGPASVVPLRVELLMLMLPRYLSLPPDLKPQAGEAVMTFIDRVIASARDRGDTALLMRARDAKRVLSKGSQAWSTGGMSAFMAGQNQEAAGQYAQAVISYNNALKNGTDDISPKLVGEKLDGIKAAHPREYEQGLAYFLSPPRPPDYPYPHVVSGPVSMGAPPAPPNPALAVPAATAAGAASRAPTPHP